MLGVDGRTFRVVWTIFLFALLFATIYAIRKTLILLAVAIFVAYMIAPLVSLAERFVSPKRRGLALGIVYILLVGVVGTVGFTLGSAIIDQASAFASHLPALLQQGKLQTIPLPSWLEPLRNRIIVIAQHEAANLQESLLPLLQRAGTHIVSGITSIVLVVLVPIISFFLLKDARSINQFLMETIQDASGRRTLQAVMDDVHELLGQYIRSLVLLACAAFAAWALFLSFLGAPYQLLLAGVSGALEFIPGVGPALALATLLIVYAVSGFTTGLLWIAVFWVCFRLFQDYVLSPYLLSTGVQLHPLLVLLGVLAGGHIGGVPGLFFSVPVIAILKTVFVRLRQAKMRETAVSPPSVPL